MARTVTIEVSSRSPAEVAAEIFALLIHPESDSEREELFCAEMNRQIQYWAKIDPEWVEIPQLWPGKYLLFDPERAEKLHRQAMRIFDKRLIAAEIARAFAVEVLWCRGPLFQRAGIKLTEDGEPIGALDWETVGLWALRQERRLAGRHDDPDKVHWKTAQERIWARSKPVLHLAIAFLTMLRGTTVEERQASWAEIFNDLQKMTEFFKAVECWRIVLLQLAQNGRIKLTENELIRVVAK
jgi:hypothetical protein